MRFDISINIELMERAMPRSISQVIEQLLTVTGRQLSLCCHREVGNLPLETLRRSGTHAGRLR